MNTAVRKGCGQPGVPLSRAFLPSSPAIPIMLFSPWIPFELVLLCKEHLLPEPPSSVIDRSIEPVSEVGAFQESAGIMYH